MFWVGQPLKLAIQDKNTYGTGEKARGGPCLGFQCFFPVSTQMGWFYVPPSHPGSSSAPWMQTILPHPPRTAPSPGAQMRDQNPGLPAAGTASFEPRLIPSRVHGQGWLLSPPRGGDTPPWSPWCERAQGITPPSGPYYFLPSVKHQPTAAGVAKHSLPARLSFKALCTPFTEASQQPPVIIPF